MPGSRLVADALANGGGGGGGESAGSFGLGVGFALSPELAQKVGGEGIRKTSRPTASSRYQLLDSLQLIGLD